MAYLNPLPDDDFAQDDPHCANCGLLEEDCECEEFEPDDEIDEGDEDLDSSDEFDEDEDDDDEEEY